MSTCSLPPGQLASRLRAAALGGSRLPPAGATVVPLDAGYMVVRRRAGHPSRSSSSAGGGLSGAPSQWSTVREHRYQKQLQSLRLLARLRLALPPPAAGEAAEQRFCSVAAAFAARTPPQQQRP